MKKEIERIIIQATENDGERCMQINCSTSFWANAAYHLMKTLRKEHREAYEKVMEMLIVDDLDPEEKELLDNLFRG